MPRKILVTGGPVGPIDFVETHAGSEHELQEILRGNPQLLPAEDLGLDGELLVVGRETRLASGAVDLLCLSKTGELVIIEFKTGPQNPDFRQALAQVIDYGSDIWKLGDWASFDEGVVHRYLRSPYVETRYSHLDDLHALANEAWSLTEDDWGALTDRLGEVIKTGDFHFVVAAQAFVEPMRVSVSYLNETSRVGRYFLIEVIRLDGAEQTAYAAQVIHRPEVRTGSASSPAGKASEDAFLSAIIDADYREAISELFASAKALGLIMAWGSKGSSIRVKTPDQAEPMSVGWVFLEGDQWTWAKHVTFGVDPATLTKHPSVESAVLDFCGRLRDVPGGKDAGGKSNAVIFEPASFVRERGRLIGLLTELASAINA